MMKKRGRVSTEPRELLKPDYHEYDSIGKFLKDTRLYLKSKSKKKFTQLEVAFMCGYDVSQQISNIEREAALPSLDLAVKLMEIYGIEREAMYTLYMKYREAQYRKVFLAKSIK